MDFSPGCQPDQPPHSPTTENLSDPEIGSSEGSRETQDFDDFDDSDDSEYDGYICPPLPDADISNIHASNQELREREATKLCFEIFDKLESLGDNKSRDQIGRMPRQWSSEAIPLFEHNGADYQLHFAYTWLRALHTYAKMVESEPYSADWDLYGLAGVTQGGHLEVILAPLTVVSLGKLFINKSDQLTWTGYELFVSGSLEVWMIHIPTKYDPVMWNTIDTGFFTQCENQPGQTGKCKLARFCRSLRGLKTAAFEMVQKEVAVTKQTHFTDFYILELSKSDIQKFVALDLRYTSDISFRERDSHRREPVLKSGKIILRPGPASSQLLLLAEEYPRECFVRFSPVAHEVATEQHSSLLSAAVFECSWDIIKKILAAKNIDAYANDDDFSLRLLHIAVQHSKKAFVEQILARIQPNLVSENSETPFTTAIRRGESKLVKLLLDTKRVDLDQLDGDGRKPLDVAWEYVNLSKKKTAANPKISEARGWNFGQRRLREELDRRYEIVRMLEEYSKQSHGEKGRD
ncbi:hypothetical protein F5Y14DRAFT_432326 [Nemania sp. NC0429]|nr:hypothetical protein F5Y14DRAFT_432326 [Nemania sp. NC0429]